MRQKILPHQPFTFYDPGGGGGGGVGGLGGVPPESPFPSSSMVVTITCCNGQLVLPGIWFGL